MSIPFLDQRPEDEMKLTILLMITAGRQLVATDVMCPLFEESFMIPSHGHIAHASGRTMGSVVNVDCNTGYVYKGMKRDRMSATCKLSTFG